MAVETGDDGRAHLRFGDNVFGRAPEDDATFDVAYRVGVGIEGNVGSDAISHVVETGGTQSRSPTASRSSAIPCLRGAASSPRAWPPSRSRRPPRSGPVRAGPSPKPTTRPSPSATSSSAEPSPASAGPAAGTPCSSRSIPRRLGLPPANAERIAGFVEGFALAGYDLEIVPPHYVPLAITLEICADADHFRPDVEVAVRQALTTGIRANGQLGFFHPDRFTFGQPLFLSRLYAAVADVDGVDAVVAVRFSRLTDDEPESGGSISRANLDQGAIPIGPLEIIRLDDDPDFPENGLLQLTMRGASDGRHARPDRQPAIAPARSNTGSGRTRRSAGRCSSRSARWERARDPEEGGGADATRPLSAWTTRSADDFGIAFLEMWAYLGDILTFYQERIANEAYLRTTVQARSTAMLVSLIGYRPGPGRAAVAHLAFETERDATVELPAGLLVQSVPGQDETPQKFETLGALSAFASLNTIRPRTLQDQALPRGGTRVTLAGADLAISPGDWIAIAGDERRKDPGSERWDVRRVAEVVEDAAAGTTTIGWIEGLGSPRRPGRGAVDPDPNPEIWVFRGQAWPFGYNAPDYRMFTITSQEQKDLFTAEFPDDWNDRRLPQEPSRPDHLYLDTVYPGILEGSWVALVAAYVEGERRTTGTG